MPRSTAASSRPARAYAFATLAGLLFLVYLEAAYFWCSPAPTFAMPSVDSFGQTAIGRDFLNMWIGGRSALEGGPAGYLDSASYRAHLLAVTGLVELNPYYYWSYPPHILLFIWPLGLMPYLAGLAVWSLAGFCALFAAARLGGLGGRELLFVLAAPAVAFNLVLGQNGAFTAALLIAGLSLMDRRPIVAGVLFGILTIKPQLGPLLPVMLLLTGRWRVIAAALATFALLAGATAALYGVEVWHGFLTKTMPQQAALQTIGDGLLFYQIGSAFYSGRLVGLPVSFVWALQAVVSALGLAVVAWAFARRRDRDLSIALLLTGTLLVSPYWLSYDMVVFGWILARIAQRDDNAPLDHALLLAVWSLPLTMMLAAFAAIPLAMLVLPAFAGRLLWRLARARVPVAGREPPTAAPAAPPAPLVAV